MKHEKTSILLADDHLIVRMGLALLISRQKDMTLVGEAENGAAAVSLAHQTRPDVIIMDIQMPVLDGAAATREILADNPGAKILILTTFGGSAEVARALEAGALGAVSKDCSQESLLDAIRATARGESVVDEDIRAALASFRDIPQLSERQIEILNCASKGLENAEIAQLIGISPDGIKKHLKTIYAALGVSTRTEAASLALRLGLIG